MGLLGIGQSNLTTPIERVDILPRHSGASRNLMLVPPFSSASATGFAPEIGAESVQSNYGTHPAGVCPRVLDAVNQGDFPKSQQCAFALCPSFRCPSFQHKQPAGTTPTWQRHRPASYHTPAPAPATARSRFRRLARVAGRPTQTQATGARTTPTWKNHSGSIHSLTGAGSSNGPFQIAATGLRSRMFLSQHHGPVAGVAPVQRRRLGHPPHRV